MFNLLLRYQLLHRSFSKRKKSRQSFSPTPFGTLFNQPRRKWACAYSDDPGAHNSGRRSSDEEEKTIQPFEIGQGRGRVSSFSNCDGVRGEGVWKRVCCANVLCVVFKAARLRVAAGWMEPWSCFRYALLPSREEVARDDPHFLPASLTTSLSNWVISNYKAIGQPTHTWMEQFAPEFISTDRPGKRVSAWNSLSFRALVNGNALRSPKAILSRKSVSFLLFVLFVSLCSFLLFVSLFVFVSSEPLSNFEMELLEIKGRWLFTLIPMKSRFFPRFCWKLRFFFFKFDFSFQRNVFLRLME